MCGHGLAHDSMLWPVLYLHGSPRKRTAAEILVEAKLSAKAGPEVTPGSAARLNHGRENQLGRA
jgi:hypothetical protein